MNEKCTDCGCPLNCHDAGFCYNEGCCKGAQCEHLPLKFDTSTYKSGRWVPGPSAMCNRETPLYEALGKRSEREEPWASPDATGDDGAQQKKLRVCVAYGTRPEKIKLAPVIDALRAKGVEVVEWCSGQSKDLAGAGQARWGNLHSGVASCIESFTGFLEGEGQGWPPQPVDCVVVQGDTATAFACAQAAFLARVPVAHVEAGLRTYSDEPWPEEAFRRQICAVAKWHFAPDYDAAMNVLGEGGDPFTTATRIGADHVLEQKGIFVVGNTVIDTLPKRAFRVLVTLHRRENWGERIANALRTIYEFHNAHSGVIVDVIKHPNWSQHQSEPLPGDGTSDMIGYSDPVARNELLEMVKMSAVVVTDSGGLQEEAAHFGVPCIVLRTSTERTALLQNGAVELIDPDSPSALRDALEAKLARRRAYGAGDAGARIAEILVRELASLDNHSSEA